MEDKMKFLLEERFALFNKLCTTYYESSFFNKERENIFKEVKKEIENFVNNKETISKMEQLINDYKDDIITRLHNDFPFMSDKDRLIYSLLLAGFSAKAIAVITGVSRDVVYARKSRLKKKIAKLDSDNKAIYEKYLV